MFSKSSVLQRLQEGGLDANSRPVFKSEEKLKFSGSRSFEVWANRQRYRYCLKMWNDKSLLNRSSETAFRQNFPWSDHHSFCVLFAYLCIYLFKAVIGRRELLYNKYCAFRNEDWHWLQKKNRRIKMGISRKAYLFVNMTSVSERVAIKSRGGNRVDANGRPFFEQRQLQQSVRVSARGRRGSLTSRLSCEWPIDRHPRPPDWPLSAFRWIGTMSGSCRVQVGHFGSVFPALTLPLSDLVLD